MIPHATAAVRWIGGLAVGGAVLLLTAGTPDRPTAAVPSCDSDNGGITLPDGFCAVVVADQVGRARHLAVTPSGDILDRKSTRLNSSHSQISYAVFCLKKKKKKKRAAHSII